MSILTNLLKTIGASSIDELSPEEKKTYSEWESALNGRQITSDEVRQFLDVELEDSTAKLIEQRLGDREDIFLKMKVDFIRKLSTFLDAPKRETEAVEALVKSNL